MAAIAVESCTVEQLLQAVSQRKVAGPSSVKQIQSALPKHLRRCDEALVEALNSGRLWKFGTVRGADQYWIESPGDYAWKIVIAKLKDSNGGATTKDLLKWLSTGALKGVIEPQQQVEQFVTTQRLFAQPKKGKAAAKYTLEPFEFVHKLVDELLVTVRKLSQQAGFDPDQAIERLRAAFTQLIPADPAAAVHMLQPTDSVTAGEAAMATLEQPASQNAAIRDQLLQAMREINPRVDENDLVQIPELRQRLDFQQIDKSTFDRVLLDMYYSQQVILFKTSAGQLSELERQTYLCDDEGHFYNTVSLWKAP